MRGPPMPAALDCGHRCFTPASSKPASRSPDASPATNASFGAANASGVMRASAHQAAGGHGQEVEHLLHVFVTALAAQTPDLLGGLLQGQALAEDQLVHAADHRDAFGAEAAPLQSGEIDRACGQ